MPPAYRIAPVDQVPDEARVCHYDELDEPAKESFPTVAGRADTTTTDTAFESTVESCDLVKFTDYYTIERV